MRFGIDIGHNCYPDTGAVGIKFEDDLTLDVGNRVINKLRNLGHTVIECKPLKAATVKESLAQRCEKANTNQVDIFVSIHFNAFNGLANGTEVYAVSEVEKKTAKSVLDEIVKLGFFNRGVKSGSHLFVEKNTNMPAILIEVCFVDSPQDMSLFDGENIANAITTGLTRKFFTQSLLSIPDEEENTDTSIIRLQRILNRLKIKDETGKVLDEDNIIGPATISAIKNFQQIIGVQTTGICGDITWNAINQIMAKRIVRNNHAGGIVVRYLQHRLHVDVDGIYGPQTTTAIKSFQQEEGLSVDGIVGPQTWRKLIG